MRQQIEDVKLKQQIEDVRQHTVGVREKREDDRGCETGEVRGDTRRNETLRMGWKMVLRRHVRKI